jgi:hypothetical protein
MLLYTGAAYAGQNNMTTQGCLHAIVNYASPEAKNIAVTIMRKWVELEKQEITTAQLIEYVTATQSNLSILEEQARDQLTWALDILINKLRAS